MILEEQLPVPRNTAASKITKWHHFIEHMSRMLFAAKHGWKTYYTQGDHYQGSYKKL